MSGKNNNHISSHDFEIERKRFYRKHYSARQKLEHFTENYSWIIFACFLLLSFLFPVLAIPIIVLFVIFLLIVRLHNKTDTWEWRRPVYEDQQYKAPISNQQIEKESGIMYLGNVADTNKALWLCLLDLVTHGLIFGTTGSGKTELLFAMMYQFMLMGSGFIFCDGKADVKSWFALYTMARELGMEDNVLVLNFITAGHSQITQHTKSSNTLNPFAHGSSEALMEIVSGFMGSSRGSDTMWRDRAEVLGRCLLRALCELRDIGEIELTVDVIRDYMPLEKIESLLEHPRLSELTKKAIQHYLNELPAWAVQKQAKAASVDDGSEMDAKVTAATQHGYLTMQFTKVFDTLAETYSRITKTDLAEVDFKDVITNRRILYIMLPSLEKSPDSLRDLGRMVVYNVRNALAGLLGGDKLTGDRKTLLDSKVTNAATPYALFFDEYGSYAVHGFGDVCAQSRSLNISTWFAGQDFESFKKGSEVEAGRIYSNTGIKIFMKTEGGGQTSEVAAKRSGEAYVYTADNIEQQNSLVSDSTKTGKRYGIKKTARITSDDLVALKPGESYVMFGEYLWRINSFYCDLKLLPKAKINSFIKLRSPNDSNVWPVAGYKEWEAATAEETKPEHLSAGLVSYIKQTRGDA